MLPTTDSHPPDGGAVMGMPRCFSSRFSRCLPRTGSRQRMTPEEKKRRLVWQCRRGLKETDVVLNAYLDEHFLTATAEHQALFERLLACQDADMFEWFTGRTVPD